MDIQIDRLTADTDRLFLLRNSNNITKVPELEPTDFMWYGTLFDYMTTYIFYGTFIFYRSLNYIISVVRRDVRDTSSIISCILHAVPST